MVIRPSSLVISQLRVGVEGKEGKLTLAQRTLNKEQVTLSKEKKLKYCKHERTSIANNFI